MELIAKGSFYRDLLKHSDTNLLKAVSQTLQNLQSAKQASQIHNLKKLRKYKTLYRIKIAATIDWVLPYAEIKFGLSAFVIGVFFINNFLSSSPLIFNFYSYRIDFSGMKFRKSEEPVEKKTYIYMLQMNNYYLCNPKKEDWDSRYLS